MRVYARVCACVCACRAVRKHRPPLVCKEVKDDCEAKGSRAPPSAPPPAPPCRSWGLGIREKPPGSYSRGPGPEGKAGGGAGKGGAVLCFICLLLEGERVSLCAEGQGPAAGEAKLKEKEAD